MKKDNKNISSFIVFVLREFSRSKCLEVPEAFDYLYKYKGINYLEVNYNSEHTLSINEIINDLVEVCKNNGENIK